jgi:DNA polymerase
MSQMTARSAVFLEEMGVGTQWTLRNRPVQEAAPEADVADEPAEVAVPAAQVVTAPMPEAVVAPAPPPAPLVAEAVAPVAPPVVAAPAPQDEDSTAWFDEAPAPVRAEPVSDAAIAAMDWPALKAAVAGCTRCDLCETRRNAVNGRGGDTASWIAVIAAPSRLDEKDNLPVAGEAGQLLDNMLKAIALKPASDVYVTNLVKCRPAAADGTDRAPSGEELLACRPFFERELALTGATMAMTFGQYAAKGLMMGPAARAKVMRYGAGQLPVVATYHPDDLLRKPEDKAKAWADLCLARTARD